MKLFLLLLFLGIAWFIYLIIQSVQYDMKHPVYEEIYN